MFMLRNSSVCAAGELVAGTDWLGFRLNQDDLAAGLVGATVATLLFRRLNGRSVKPGRYSMMNSLSSFVGDVGTPNCTGADSPLNKSPKILDWRFGVFSRPVTAPEVLSLGKAAAQDLARVCNAEAVGLAVDIEDSHFEPRPSLVSD